MSRVKSYVHGIYPRSEALIQVSRDVIRKRGNEAEYEAQYEKDRENFLKLQQSLDLDFIEDGKLRWHDIFRPIVEATEGLETGALTRWFDNNCFFRQPILKGDLKLDEKKLEKYFSAVGSHPPIAVEGKLSGNDSGVRRWKVTLPSPFTFAKLVQNETGRSFDKALTDITAIMAQVIAYLERRGAALVQFNEPYLSYNGATSEDLKLFKRSVSQLGKAKGKLAISIHFYFGDSAPVIGRLGKIDIVDIIGVDFYKTSLSSLPKDLPYILAAGVLDGRNSLLEDEATLKRFIEKILKTLRIKYLYITNNSDLELLPEIIARKKVELLAKVRNNF